MDSFLIIKRGIADLIVFRKWLSLSKISTILFRTLLILLYSTTVCAQFEVSPSNSIPVNFGNGTAMRNPWTGGVNAVHISQFDLESTGANDDLFVFDKAGNRVLIFDAIQEDGVRKYNFKPLVFNNFPAARDWALLRDFDCDGKMDFFTYSLLGGSFSAYRNTSNPGGPLQFVPETDMILSLYEFSTNTFTTNIYVSTQDVPAIVDFDGDGDLDILAFSVGGTSLEFHENFSMDNEGSCSLNGFKLRNRCYGQFSEGSENNSIEIGDPCTFNVINPKSGSRHIGSTIFTLDGNGDGLQDIVLGDVTFPNLTYLENSVGNLGMDSVVSASPDFPANIGNLQVSLDNFPVGFHLDLDGDGARDLLVTTNNVSFSKNTESIWHYKNTGLEELPYFEFVQQDFLQDQMIDLGDYSSVAFFDYNSDGLKDMVVSSRGAYLGAEAYKPVLALFTNIGTSANPHFQETDSDWLSIFNLGVGTSPHCSFGDLDNDGDIDMIVGDLSGKLHHFTNTAGPGNTAVFELTGFLTSNSQDIDVGQQSTPQIYDLDGDEMLDLIVGERVGNLNYYRNTGTPGNFQFTLISENLGGVNTTEPEFFIGSSAPHLYVHEGQTYLLSGTEPGRLYLYNNIDGNENGTYTLISTEAFGVQAGGRSRPWIIDIDNDGATDIFSGSVGGGVLFYEGNGPFRTGENENLKKQLLVHPNPANDELYIQLSTAMEHFAHYNIMDVQGRVVLSGMLADGRIEVGMLGAGLYVLEVNSEGRVARTKWIKE